MLNRRWPIVFAVVLVGALAACAPAAATPGPARISGFAPTAAPAATSVPAGPGQPGLLPPAGQMIVKNADIELMVSDAKPVLVRVTQLAADDGGYVLSSQTSDVGGQQGGSIEIAVPAAQFETALNQLRDQGLKVLKENTSGQDVSAQYTDLQSRLDNLEATAARVRTFLDASKTVADSLAVNSQLSDLESQIEQIKGQMKYDEGRAAFSTISVTLTPQPLVVLPTAAPAWNPFGTFILALTALGSMLRLSTDFVIWLVVLTSPLTLVLVSVALVRRRLGRRTVARSRS